MKDKNHSQETKSKSQVIFHNKNSDSSPDTHIEPLDKKIRYGYNDKEVWGQNVIWEKDVKSSLSNLKKRLKESDVLGGGKEFIILKINDIDKLFSEEIGSGLLEGENGSN